MQLTLKYTNTQKHFFNVKDVELTKLRKSVETSFYKTNKQNRDGVLAVCDQAFLVQWLYERFPLYSLLNLNTPMYLSSGHP